MEERYLLISDVDGTLLGDDAALDRFAEWFDHRRDQFTLVYASGRFYDSVVESIRESHLPDPAAIIGGVGTDIRWFPTGEPLSDWRRQFVGWNPLRVTACLSQFPQLELQPSEFLSDYKISYYLNDASQELLHEIHQHVAQEHYRASIVYSSHRDLDVLPRGVNKGAAAHFLSEMLQIPCDRVFVAGDSENDASLFMRRFRGIIVGNAQPGLKELRAPEIYHARNAFADGVLEGLKHWLHDQYQE